MIRQFFLYSIGPFLGSFISIISIPVITRLVSPQDYGLLNLFISIFSFLYIFIAFPDYAFAKEYHKFKEQKRENYLLWNTAAISLILSLIVGIFLIVFSEELSKILFKDNQINELFYILAIMLLLAVFDRFSQISLRMQGKGLSYSIVNIENKLLILLLTLILVYLYPDHAITAILAYALAQILTSITSFYLNKSSWSLKNVGFNLGLQKKMFKFSFPIMPSSLIMWGLSSLSIVFLNGYSNFYEIGIYSGAQRIANILTVIQTAFMSFWMPMALKLDHEKVDTKEYTKVNELVLSIMTGIFLIVLFFKDGIILFLGSEYKEAILLVPFTLFFPVMYTLSEAIGVGFALKGKVHFNLIASGLSIVSFLAIGFMLIPKFGALGAAITAALSYTLLFWIKTLIATKVWYKFSLVKYIINSLLLICVSVFNSIITNWTIYLINILMIIIYIKINRSHLSLIYQYLIKIKNSRFKKRNI
ncbi:lipopolysaccharide biosynthesis protein [Niallia sp. FSL W8-0635]|uniref:lipopolysaccharide biosynthesis protein n=1 Tax=Niallia sp. FSL W8-0635 TaxID=2975337 RepID=UPI0030FB838A